jgi:hypothetical protein
MLDIVIPARLIRALDLYVIMNAEKTQELAKFMALSQTARHQFSFLADFGLILIKETLPKSLDFRDGFIFNYQNPEMSVDVQYYDMEFVINFNRKGVRASYLFIDTNLFGNQSGYKGCMFPRDKLEKVILDTAKDIRENYRQVLIGNNLIWKKIETMLNALTEKRRLPP